ncbi:MAG: hypothetical protein KKH61_20925, partial [Gammaproteobacteria bacterium]|nr:hypothetical protein [Gammaproteobacteria bacterium]
CPLFALVVPHNGASYFRDPSHTGTTSSLYNSGTLNASTAIIGGDVDSIVVQSVLNGAGIVYDVFALSSNSTTAGTWGTNAATILPVSTSTNPAGPWLPGATDTGGWWKSTDGFVSEADLITTPAHPEHPRAWDKIAAFSTFMGGSPGPAVVDNNYLIYAGDDYTLGVDQPTLRLFDGTLDKLLIKIPNTTAGVIPQAIMSMLLENGVIYISIFDSGTSASDYAGRVFAYDILKQTLTPLGSGFTTGKVPYALAWHLGRLWVGTNYGDASASGSIYYIRPGIDTDWTTDYTLTTSTVAGATSLISYKGALYVGTDNAAGSFAKLLVRAVAGTYSTSYTVTGGTAAVNNCVLSMIEFKDELYATTWNPHATAYAKVVKFNGTAWSNAYFGATTTLRPYIATFTAVDPTDNDTYLFVVGGGSAYAGMLISSPDGSTWTDLTDYLSGPLDETTTPGIGVMKL